MFATISNDDHEQSIVFEQGRQRKSTPIGWSSGTDVREQPPQIPRRSSRCCEPQWRTPPPPMAPFLCMAC